MATNPHLKEFAVYPQLWNPDTLTYEPEEASAGGGVGSDVNVTNTSLPLPTGASTGAKQDTANTSLASIDSKLGSGLASETTLGTRLSESDFDTKTGSLTETAPGTDTASSGLNGRLQRIAQRISSLITALGSPFQAGGSIGNTSFGSTVADGANVVEGAVADAAVAAGATGSISAKLRAISRDLVSNIVLAAGSNVIGHVVVDSAPSTVVTGPLTDTQLRASAVPVSLAAAPTTPVTNASLSNLDVLLSTRTKPADQQHVIVDSAAAIPVTDNAGSLTVDAPVATPVFVRLSDGAAAIATVPISASALPLPSNAASETGGNLASISTSNTTVAAATKLEDAASADGDRGLAILGVREDALGIDTSTSGDYGFLKTDAYGRLWVRADCTEALLLKIATQQSQQLLLAQAALASRGGSQFVPLEIPAFL